MISLCIYPFSQKSNKIPEFGVTTPSRTGSAISTTVSDQVFFLHKILLFMPPNDWELSRPRVKRRNQQSKTQHKTKTGDKQALD
jgi:hypothetical protein